jgi:hypothetical protein
LLEKNLSFSARGIVVTFFLCFLVVGEKDKIKKYQKLLSRESLRLSNLIVLFSAPLKWQIVLRVKNSTKKIPDEKL